MSYSRLMLVVCVCFFACGNLPANNALEAFRRLALRYYSQLSSQTPPAPTQPEETTEITDEVPAENAPKFVQFAQREQKKATEFKQVEGANAAGSATTPDTNLAAWYSEGIFDTPTRARWLDDETYDAQAVADGFEALKNPTKKTETTTKKEGTQQGKVLNAMGSGGAASGGLGTAGGGAPQENQNDNSAKDFRASMMRAGRAQRTAAESSGVTHATAVDKQKAIREKTAARRSWNNVLAHTRTTRARGAFAALRTAHVQRSTMGTQTSPREPELSPRMISRLRALSSSRSVASDQ